MHQSNLLSTLKPKTYSDLIFALVWVFIILLAYRFIIVTALPYYGLTEDAMGRWWDYKWSLIGHISGGILALVIGPFQFWKAFRSKYLTIHRWMGRIYITAILFSVISATFLAWTSAINAAEINWALGLQGLAFVWFVTTFMAYLSIRRKRIQQHKEWMIRSYVVTFAFITFRILSDSPINEYFGVAISGATWLWVSWSIPLLISEVFINWNKK
ncbi:MAG: DUF2306 domain-containing protein [Algoriphagus sp.]|uniref:DUF2306 domain-containing protein n=1 Tax=Algoriphagus sp. TaxID=1872435 RepID=UPI00182DCEC4|nr:DUF2306 domain-containing protein [Algoriphagus sp.]NVJ87457.1 DUF2306 domain-containing protein [Algoriphagus sp.]